MPAPPRGSSEELQHSKIQNYFKLALLVTNTMSAYVNVYRLCWRFKSGSFDVCERFLNKNLAAFSFKKPVSALGWKVEEELIASSRHRAMYIQVHDALNHPSLEASMTHVPCFPKKPRATRSYKKPVPAPGQSRRRAVGRHWHFCRRGIYGAGQCPVDTSSVHCTVSSGQRGQCTLLNIGKSRVAADERRSGYKLAGKWKGSSSQTVAALQERGRHSPRI